MRYCFLDCTVDSERRELRRAGERVPVRPRVFELLVYLLEQRSRAVSKAEIFERIWPRRVVSDATLNACVKELRKAVGDTGDAQRVVQTLHGHGFRFVAPLDASAPAELTSQGAAAESGNAPRMTHDVQQAGAAREYKQISVLVCSVADAEALAARLGAEPMDELMQSFLQVARATMQRYGGVICEWSGAGFMALFGAPAALEDHGRRAVQAAMDVLAAQSNAGLAIAGEQLRLGLNTGAVVVGRLSADPLQLYTAVGDTTSRARRIHDAAPPGALLASEASYRLVEAEVDATPGQTTDGELVYRIRAIAVVRGGVPQRPRRRLSKFVGRGREIELLREGLQRAQRGLGNMICIVGEPGIGKSRLIEELGQMSQSFPGTFRAAAYCLAYQANTPYFPIIALLRQSCDVGELDPAATVSSKVGAALRDAGIVATEAAGLLLELLDIEVDGHSLAELGPEARRARLFSYLTQLLLHRAARQLCLITIEDLHWIDATSQAFIEQLLACIEPLRMMIVVTCRPGYRPPWAVSAAVTQLGLSRLSTQESAQLIESVPHTSRLTPELAGEIVASAKGNPFFIEELAWSVSDDGGRAGGRVAVPSTVQAVIAARIDQLAPRDKHLLQIAAAIGSPVPADLLRSVSEYEASLYAASVRNLQAQEFLYETPLAAGTEYTFRHALTQDVAYHSLLSGTRAHYHQCIAESIEREFAEIASSRPEVLGLHWEAAHRYERAFGYWRRAGLKASERSANLEAVEHFRHALSMNEKLEHTDDSLRDRLEVLLAMGPALMATRGFAAPEVEADYAAARDLCTQVGSQGQSFTAAWGFWLHNLHRGQIAQAKTLVAEILQWAQRIDDQACWLQGHHAGWTTEITHGDLAACRRHAEQGMRLYDRTRHHAQAYLYGIHDPGLCAHGTAAIADWFLGRPDQALAGARATLELARELTHPYSWLLALNDVMWMHCVRRDIAQGRAAARQVIEVCTQQRVPNYRAFAGVFSGWAAAMEGELDAGIEEMRSNLAAYRALGLQRHCIHFFTLLAEALCERGDVAAGLETIGEAETFLARTQEIRWAPEVQRMRGRLLLLRSPADRQAALQCFEDAIAQARAQGALSLELRAANDLATLYLTEEAADRAHSLLIPVLDRFSERSDVADIVRAQQILAYCTPAPTSSQSEDRQ